jgi:hypothetical protein
MGEGGLGRKKGDKKVETGKWGEEEEEEGTAGNG